MDGSADNYSRYLVGDDSAFIEIILEYKDGLKDGTVVKTREDLCVLADNGEFTATFMASAPILSELIDSI